MIGIDELNTIALSVEEAMKRVLDETGDNMRGMVSVDVRLPHADMSEIDRRLYVSNNGTDADFVPGDEVEIDFYGIRFRITSD